MVEKIVYYKLVHDCGHQPQRGCLLECLKRQGGQMSLAQMKRVKGSSLMSLLDGNEHEVMCWRGRGPCSDGAGLLVLEMVK